MVPFALAAVQMRVAASHENVTAMRRHLAVLLHRFPWVKMVIFSELAPLGPLTAHAQFLPGPTEAALQELAALHGVWLIPGSLFERDLDGQIYNTCPVIDPQGQIVLRYRKLFPFRPYEAGVASGREFGLFDVPGVGRFGIAICYDLWFPEVARTLTGLGAEVILHPVLTDTLDRETELAIAQATAAQFQCYVIDVNGIGAGGVGRSIVVDPAGNRVHVAGGEEEIMPLEIDLAQVRRQREVGFRGLGQQLKAFRDRGVEFRVYDRLSGLDAYLHSLGPLELPGPQTPPSLAAPPPAEAVPLADRQGSAWPIAAPAAE